MDQLTPNALSVSELSPDGADHKAAEVQSLIYQTMPLCEMSREQAIDFCKALYSPEERFSLGFYRYWRDIINLPEEEAWQYTLDELDEYLERLLSNLDDPNYHSIGFNRHGEYVPVGMYGFRALQDHSAGQKLYQSMQERGILENYPGKLAIAHSYSALNGYRNRVLLKYAFLLIALEAIQHNYKHIFFFMSDYRLESVYKRFGLEFPKELTFSDSQHLVGCYNITTEHLREIYETAQVFDHCVPFMPLPQAAINH